jgi:hypothetical protein
MGARRRVQGIVEDPLFWRVAVCLFGLPFAYLGVSGVVALSPPEGWWWLGVVLLAALGLYGGFLVYAACFGSKGLFERATRYIHEGGDLLGLLFVLVVGLLAIPITVLLRWLRPRVS